MMLVDSHCHLTDAQFDADRDAVVQRATSAGVVAMVCAGADVESSRAAVRLAEQYASVYAVVGIHPEHAQEFNDDVLKTIRELAQHRQVVGIGEIGLDFHYADAAPREAQEKNFIAQLDLAQELGLPVVIHDRDAHDALMEILRKRGNKSRGILHCFSGDLPMAREAIDLGYFVSFAGNLTFQNARQLREIVAAAPLDRVVIETDAPYLAPMPHRGKRNEPAYVARVAEKIAEIKNLPLQTVQDTTMRNSEIIFRLTERIV
jgi:TatD DNase family protein